MIASLVACTQKLGDPPQWAWPPTVEKPRASGSRCQGVTKWLLSVASRVDPADPSGHQAIRAPQRYEQPVIPPISPKVRLFGNAIRPITQTSRLQDQPSPWRFVLQVNIRKPAIDELFATNATGY